MLTATVSGSFHRHMDGITSAVQGLIDVGVRVLSPADPRVVEARGDFLFVASDRVRSVRLVQDRHLESIRGSDFLWLVAPDGYVGQSASMEIGFAAAVSTPVYSLTRPYDLTLRQYVHVVPDLKQALDELTGPRKGERSHILINPHDSVQRAHDLLQQIHQALMVTPTSSDDTTAEQVYGAREKLIRILGDRRKS